MYQTEIAKNFRQLTRDAAFIHSRDPIMEDREEEDNEEFATHYQNYYVDMSGSIKPMQGKVFAQLQSIFNALDSANKASTDIRTRVRLSFFNNVVTHFTEGYWDPHRVATALTEKDYDCRSTTNGEALFHDIDSEYHSNSEAVINMKQNNPRSDVIIITDAAFNDNTEIRAAAKRLLDSNRYYHDHVRVVVVFLGSELNKATAVAMANGKEENVVVLDTDMTELLAPVIMGSTVNTVDGTRVNSAGEQTMNELAKETTDRAQEGKESAGDLTSDALRTEFLRLMGKKVS